METKTFKVDTEVLDTKTVYKGVTKKIEINKYWDSHGREVDWGQDVKTFDKEVPFEIISKQIKYNWKYMEPTVFESWDILVNGEKLTGFELTGYKALKTKLVLHACMGAG